MHDTRSVTDNLYSPLGTSPKRTLHQVYELLLIEMESIYSYSVALPRNARYTKFIVAVHRNGICIFLFCVTSPKRTLHQVYELLLIEMESPYSFSETLSQNAHYT